ncbi:hypothetical protein ACFSHT_29090 [Paraburkholderia silviterrae]|uniref:Uncharacterized protein n=1 Tax=Paraburkholderia silviterrae TaxID=2528715 RepID=A0A4R5M5H2_9BURK|nr:hypothetical protein [Paraburkholderia silviterrae]TDG21121.1 hypothetical protein EYW47_22365 [Paraburkholderia silviterrae]
MTTLADQARGTGAAAMGSPRFTRDDCDKIHDYVTYASSLPTILQAVEVFVGYRTAGVAGLEPADLRTLFERIRSNADDWDPTKDMITQQATTLLSISDRIVRSGELLIDAIKALPPYVRACATVGADLSELPVGDIPDESFGPADIQGKSQLAGKMESLQKINREQVGDTAHAMRLLLNFREGVVALEPVVAGKRLVLKNSNREKIGNEITVEPMIAAFQREYDLAVQSNPRDAAIVEAKRRELDTAIQTLKSQMEVYRSRQRVTYTMGRLFVHFTELGLVMLDAEMAVTHLWLAWQEACVALTNAAEQFDSIDGRRKLLTFLIDFKTIINNWKFVQSRAMELSSVF